jgi:hypothetical protein
MCGTLRTALVVSVAALAGCNGPDGGGRASLGPQDFLADTPATTPRAGLDRALSPGGGGRMAPLDASKFRVAEGAMVVPPAVDPTELTGPAESEVVQSRPGVVLFDVKVGEVNNKPIFAAEFLRPVAQRLRALAYQEVAGPGGTSFEELKPRLQWQSEASAIIDEQLLTFVNNELVIAQGLASFTPAQRSGLRNFLGIARSSLEQSAGGSITRAVRTLGTGQTLSEYLQEVRNKQLIAKFADDLRRSVVVTRSDVERAYLRQYGDDRAKSAMSYRWIRVRSSDAEGVARISDRLSRGEPFAVVATDEANGSRRSEGGLGPAIEFEGEFAEATFFPGDPEIDSALRELTPGEWAGPFAQDRFTHWIYLEGIEIGYKTWAEAQSEIRQRLYDTRVNDAYQREMLRLYEQAGLTDLTEMRNELLMVATDWFYPAQ